MEIKIKLINNKYSKTKCNLNNNISKMIRFKKINNNNTKN